MHLGGRASVGADETKPGSRMMQPGQVGGDKQLSSFLFSYQKELNWSQVAKAINITLEIPHNQLLAVNSGNVPEELPLRHISS